MKMKLIFSSAYAIVECTNNFRRMRNVAAPFQRLCNYRIDNSHKSRIAERVGQYWKSTLAHARITLKSRTRQYAIQLHVIYY